MIATRRIERCDEPEPRSRIVVESVDSFRSLIRVERSWRSREVDALPSTIFTIDESQMDTWTWNEFLMLLVMIIEESMRTVPLALTFF